MGDDNKVEKPGTVIYNDWLNKCKRMSDEQFGRTMRIVLQYAQDQCDPEIDDVTIGTVFEFIKSAIDRDIKKYQNKTIANHKNGMRGGRPPKNITQYKTNETQTNRDHLEETQQKPKEPLNGKRITDNGDRVTDMVETDTTTSAPVCDELHTSTDFLPSNNVGAVYRAAFGVHDAAEAKALADLVVDYRAQRVCMAIRVAAERDPPPDHPIEYIRAVCEGRQGFTTAQDSS